jgi:cyclic pyranopterin phosphate synthase
MNSSITPLQSQPMVKDQLNRPLRDLRISVIDRCNYRCPYCMPEEVYGDAHQFLPRKHWLTPGELKRIGGLFVNLGVNKLRITGGEPLLRRDLPEIVHGLAGLEGLEDIALTTNGTRLAARAKELKEAGLKRITISFDSLDPDVFRLMNGNRGDVDQVLEGIEAAVAVGFEPVKLNCMVQRGKNDHTVLDLLGRFRGTGVIVRFIEYMDVGTMNGWRADQVISSKVLLDTIGARWPVEALSRNYRGEVAQRYAYEDGQGEIGFISSVSEPFCGDCHRARLSAEGMIYTCLFANQGTDLRGPLREGASDADLIGLLQHVWRGRRDRYSEVRGKAISERDRVEMYRMGG